MDKLIDSLIRSLREPGAAEAVGPKELVDALLDLRGGVRDLQAELAAYQDMARKVSTILSELDIEVVLTRLLDTAVELSGAERGFLMQRVAPDRLEVVRARDFGKTDLNHIREEFSQRVMDESVRADRLLLVADVREWDALHEHSSVRRQGILSFMVVPFRSDGVVLGVLYLDSRQPARVFTPEVAQRVDLLAQQAAPALRQANILAELKRANGAMREQFRRLTAIESVIGTSPALQKALAAVSCVAPTNAPVLLTGETGTGKELIAQIIHRNSPRSDRPLVTLNCAAIPPDLLEAELFGYRQGAFTGAVRDNPGKISMAEGGTLLLDEISELSAPLQAKLLRFIQLGEIQRLGERKTLRVDVRILAATNRDLSIEAQEGRFRRDLFYRLSVINIHLPPLRERREDIPLLTDHFLRVHRPQSGRLSLLSRGVLDCLQRYDFPGNVRELESAIRRCCIMAGEGNIRREHLPETIAASPATSGDLPASSAQLKERKRRLVADLERAFLTAALDRARGSVSRAAREAGMKRSRFQFLMRRRGLDSRRWRKNP
ncbi:MAG: sigma 54-interacting transcriptional regulator [Planctomycetes bacterium]|nr:sigma 54-interacting transcriptional regulator [Planctomycetota bacterium]